MTNTGGLDQNSRRTLSALSSANDGSIVNIWADPITHRLLVDNASSGVFAQLASSPTFQKSSGQSTILTLKAPSGDPQEATMTTMLDLGSGNREFVDWTIENYGSDHIASINVSKAGTGTLLPISMRFWNQDLGPVSSFGVKTMTWLPTGEVGIGTASPSEILHISKPTGNFTTIRYDSGSTQGYFFSYDGDNSVNIGANSNSQLNFKVNNSTKASLATDGTFILGLGIFSTSSVVSTNKTFTLPNETGTVTVATSGSGAPGTTPVAVGLIYCDTSGGKVYVSTGTASSGDWKILN